MTAQTPAAADMEKWLRILSQTFSGVKDLWKFSLSNPVRS